LTVAIGTYAPDFTALRDGGGTLKLSDFRGEKVVLYFYPKDDTSGCTAQACAFTENISAFHRIKARIIGVSRDSVKKHDKFVEKYGLKFPLVADEDGKICEAYGVWVEKSMYGKKYMGIERTTFLIDEKGKIAQIWNKVKVPGHADEVIAELEKI